MIRSSDSGLAPKTLKLFVNRDGMDFGAAAELESVQTFDLPRSNDILDIQVMRPRFSNVYSLTMFIEDNHGDEVTEIFYIGFKGDFMKLNREPVEFLYEAAANPHDHKPIVGTRDVAEQSNQHGI